MSVDYVDQSDGGWMTRDYTMDQSDLARMNVTGQTKRGVPIVDGLSDNGLFGPGMGYDNYRANGYSADPTTGRMVAPNVGVQVPGVVGNASGRPATNVTSQPAAGVPAALNIPPVPGGSIASDAAFGLAQTPLDYSSPTALANSRASRASFVPGGSALYDKLVASGTYDPASTTPSSLLSGLADADGKPLPGNQIDSRIATHPAFQQMERMDGLNGTNNAAMFYQNMTGRSLQSDRAANSALLSAQSSNKLKDANTLQSTLTQAPMDDKDKGIHAGDYVKQVMVQGLLPGTQSLQYVPLTPYERELANILPDTNGDGSQKTDQFGRSSYSPRGNSYLQQATGLPSAADLGWGKTTVAQLKAERNAASAPAPVPGKDPTVRGAVPLDQQETAGQQSANVLTRAVMNSGTTADNALTGIDQGIYNTGQSIKGGINFLSGLFGGSGAAVSAPAYRNFGQQRQAENTATQLDSINVANKAHSDYLEYKRTGQWPEEPQYDYPAM